MVDPPGFSKSSLLVDMIPQDREVFEFMRGRLEADGMDLSAIGLDPRRSVAGYIGSDFENVLPWVLHHLAEPTIGIAFLKISKDILVEWIRGKAGRRISVAVAGQKVEVRGNADIDKCISALKKLSLTDNPAAISRRRRGKGRGKIRGEKKFGARLGE